MAAYETFPDGFLVAEEDGHVVGFVTTVVVALFDVKILSIAVDKRCQSKGFAIMLLKALFHVLRAKGILRLLLEVRLSNTRAQRLYLSLGFNLVKVISAYYQDGEDAYLMERLLLTNYRNPIISVRAEVLPFVLKSCLYQRTLRVHHNASHCQARRSRAYAQPYFCVCASGRYGAKRSLNSTVTTRVFFK